MKNLLAIFQNLNRFSYIKKNTITEYMNDVFTLHPWIYHAKFLFKLNASKVFIHGIPVTKMIIGKRAHFFQPTARIIKRVLFDAKSDAEEFNPQFLSRKKMGTKREWDQIQTNRASFMHTESARFSLSLFLISFSTTNYLAKFTAQNDGNERALSSNTIRYWLLALKQLWLNESRSLEHGERTSTTTPTIHRFSCSSVSRVARSHSPSLVLLFWPQRSATPTP